MYEYNHKDITSWTHDGLDPVLSTNAKTVTQYLRDGNQELVGDQSDSASPRWYLTDMLGSIAGDTNANGTAASAIVNYSDYGNQLGDSAYAFGFTGEHMDPAGQGATNYLARTYLPSAAQFAQTDPRRGALEVPVSLGRYGYVRQSPASLTDRYGLSWGWLPAAIVAATVLGFGPLLLPVAVAVTLVFATAPQVFAPSVPKSNSNSRQQNRNPSGNGKRSPTSYSLTRETLAQLAPNVSGTTLDNYAPYLSAAMRSAGLTTPQRQAAFLSQIIHESDGLQALEEYASGAAYEGRLDLGNTQAGDGPRYKGRGVIQLTGRSNYAAFTQARPDLGVDFVAHPELVSDPRFAFEAASWFWSANNLNSYADRGDIYGLGVRVNGGTNGMADRLRLYELALSRLTD